MTAASILRSTAAAGLTLSLSAAGTIKAAGEQAAVDRWLAAIREPKAAIIVLLSEAAQSRSLLASRCGVPHVTDREPLELALSPGASQADVLDAAPVALAAEPIESRRRQPDTMLTGDQEGALRAWLAQIGEDEASVIVALLTICKHDDDARAYFLGSTPKRDAGTRCGELVHDVMARSCARCFHRRRPGLSVGYCGSGRADLLPAYGENHPLRKLPSDRGRDWSHWQTMN